MPSQRPVIEKLTAGHLENTEIFSKPLHVSWPAFYLGSVAPDCQEVANVSRETTHFYGIPPQPDNQAYPCMLAQYPQLWPDSTSLPPEQAMFVAAYSVHLLYDLIWFRDVLMPYFVNAKKWTAAFEERRMVHHIVLTYLDKLAYDSLPETAVTDSIAFICEYLHIN